MPSVCLYTFSFDLRVNLRHNMEKLVINEEMIKKYLVILMYVYVCELSIQCPFPQTFVWHSCDVASPSQLRLPVHGVGVCMPVRAGTSVFGMLSYNMLICSFRR